MNRALRKPHRNSMGLFIALLAAGTLTLGGLTAFAQDDSISLAQAQRIFRSNDSHLRHQTWIKLNPEDSGHYKLLVKILKGANWYDRDGAITALAQAATPDTLEKMTTALKEDRNPFVRQGMAWALAKMNQEEMYPHLYQALDDEDPWVRRVVANVLRVHRKPPTVDALVERFLVEDDPVVATFIEQTLNELTQVYHGPDPAAWSNWWIAAKADPDYELGDQLDEEAARQAEALGKKLREQKTAVAQAGITEFKWSERGTDEGVPILILPPYGYSKQIMLPFLAELEKSHKLFYIDLPPIDSFSGLELVGNTGLPFYPIDRLVTAFEDLRQKTEKEHFAIMACGLNSWVAMRYAQLQPDSIAAMIFVGPISGNKEYGLATKRLVELGQKRDDYEMHHFGLSRTVNTQTGESTHQEYHRKHGIDVREGEGRSLDRKKWSLFFKDQRDFVCALLYDVKDYRMGGVMIPDFSLFREKAPSRRFPVLVFAGRASILTSVDDCRAIAKYYGTRPIIMKNSSLMPFAEEGPLFNEHVKAFLKPIDQRIAKAKKDE